VAEPLLEAHGIVKRFDIARFAVQEAIHGPHGEPVQRPVEAGPIVTILGQRRPEPAGLVSSPQIAMTTLTARPFKLQAVTRHPDVYDVERLKAQIGRTRASTRKCRLSGKRRHSIQRG
jgi:hypothetical protein